MIAIQLDHGVVEAGGFLTGRVTWSGAPGVDRIIAAAQWETHGHGNRIWGLGRSVVHIPPRAAQDATFPFRMLIPHAGPVTIDGAIVAIGWSLRVRIDQRGFDEYRNVAFRVVPRSRAAALPPHS